MEKLYINIRKRRTELHMTQSELAERVGYTDRSSVAKIESGSVDLPLSMVKKIAAALNVEPIKLLGWED